MLEIEPSEDVPSQENMTNPLKRIKSKVRGTPGKADPRVISKIDKIITEHSKDYREWAISDTQKLHDLLNELTVPHANHKELLDKLFLVALEMRGQGGTFGFPLISAICRNLCILLEGLKQLDQVDHTARELCQTHVDAVNRILRDNNHGNGKKIEHQVIASLEKAMRIFAERRNIKLEF